MGPSRQTDEQLNPSMAASVAPCLSCGVPCLWDCGGRMGLCEPAHSLLATAYRRRRCAWRERRSSLTETTETESEYEARPSAEMDVLRALAYREDGL